MGKGGESKRWYSTCLRSVQVELISLSRRDGREVSPKSSPLVAQATDDATLSGDEYDDILLLTHLERANPKVSAHDRLLLRRASSIRMLSSLLILDSAGPRRR